MCMYILKYLYNRPILYNIKAPYHIHNPTNVKALPSGTLSMGLHPSGPDKAHRIHPQSTKQAAALVVDSHLAVLLLRVLPVLHSQAALLLAEVPW